MFNLLSSLLGALNSSSTQHCKQYKFSVNILDFPFFLFFFLQNLTKWANFPMWSEVGSLPLTGQMLSGSRGSLRSPIPPCGVQLSLLCIILCLALLNHVTSAWLL